MKQEFIDIVDDNNNFVRKVTWKEMSKGALLHKSIGVLVFNKKGELFVHKRAKNLVLYPGEYDMKIGGIVKSGESYEGAAKRELAEEIGAKNTKLEPLFSLRIRSKESNVNERTFKCVWDGKIKTDKKEIESGKFVSIKDAKKLYNAGKLCLSGEKALEKYLKLKIKK